jgi:hypothetical protein
VKVVDFLNTIFVTEDRSYPVEPGWYSTPDDPNLGPRDIGRDSILTVTAVDTNHYYDPRSYLDPSLHPRLTYEWWPINPETKTFNFSSGLLRWITVDTIPVDDQFDNTTQNPRDLAEGYLIFRGKPLNPYVVPGGETVVVRASNYPPHARTLDSLKALNVDPDLISKFINLFPPYFHASKYDDENARYAQQDTIDLGFDYQSKEYAFRIFVVDSTPRWLDEGYNETVTRRVDRQGTTETVVEYKGSEFPCGQTTDDPPKQIANLTDKLRFKVDFNTDDEWEDYWAENFHVRLDTRLNQNPVRGGWDFRYGKTAYGFMNVAIRLDDTTVIDTTVYDKDMDGLDDDMVIEQSRPEWMADRFLHQYPEKFDNNNVQIDPDPDPNGEYLTSWAQINIRVHGDTARRLLTPPNQINGKMNLDTVFTLVVNDGHGGLNYMPVPVYINVAPTILTTSLPAAKEDYDYNPQLLDSSRMIKVFDPNFDQTHKFELIYANDQRTSIPKDACFPEAGSWDLTGLKTTPEWLKINAESGLLYGKPGIKDAPRNEKVTVLVTDQYNLTDLKVLDLRVDSTNHLPQLFAAPNVRCVDINKPYVDTLWVKDRDLMRGRQTGDPTETLTFRVIEPLSGLTISPTTISGIRTNDTVKIVISSSSFNVPPDPDGKVTIKVEVTDASGMKDTLIYRLQLSEATDFISCLDIRNYLGASQVLCWGTAPRNASTGDGEDANPLGRLDSNFCEFELPPLPPGDVFDARWEIPTRSGTHRNIFPRAPSAIENYNIYKGKFQAGGVDGNTSPAYPITISWDMNDVPDKTDNTRNPSGATWYLRDAVSPGTIWNVNMKTGGATLLQTVAEVTITGSICTLTIKSNQYEGFYIMYDWASPVEPIAGLPTEYSIVKVSPNPYNTGTATIQYGLPKSSRVKIDIYDALGNMVASIFDGTMSAGYQTVQWNGKDISGMDVPSGAYSCRLSAGGSTSAYPIVIIK